MKCGEACLMLQMHTSKEVKLNNVESVHITTVEQLKLLQALSIDIEESYDRPQKVYIDLLAFSKNKNSYAQINMNLFFNKEMIYKINKERQRFDGLFNAHDVSFSINYSNEIQLHLRKHVTKALIRFSKEKKILRVGRLANRTYSSFKYMNTKERNI